ncbi:unnamed protein product (macronuclear) [Paramecium tetraurelia]|uniref:Transmembrane protein n=1 Tax=Paramecium tetraurelia TaxID=5888 RepID=A0C174_PARTE|nr:uncharacterized protein GSPATT00034017001 [Paramecium tetraurelia]CAK64541.1 unnamed protein product [Paramecium tetraurelia]|eukprot:XP_001431939.1 hypothetical protein (macronuclear) [Paramecium tetraurelia strain d4-2]
MAYQIDVNKENFDEKNIENLNLEILKEITLEDQLSIELSGDERIFKFTQGDNIDVMLLSNKSIDCLYQVKNCLQNGEIIMEKKECQILLIHPQCYQLHQLETSIYIVQCQYNENNSIIQIVNQSKILDEIMIPIQPFCKSDSTFYQQTLIIFNKQCQTTKFYSVQILNQSFQNIELFDLMDLQGFTENNAKLVDITFIIQGNLYITYTNQILHLLLENREISIFNQNSGFEIKRFLFFANQKQALIAKVKTDTQQLFLNDNQLDLSSQDFLDIFIIKQNFIVYHFKNKLIAQVDSWSSNVIYLNSNSIIQIDQLPYLMAISNQKLKLIKIILPKSVISYNNSDTVQLIHATLLSTPNKLINFKLGDPNNPIQDFDQTKLYQLITNSNYYLCLSYQRYKRTLPLKLTQIVENGKQSTILDNQNAQFLSYIDHIVSAGKVLFLHKTNNDQILIIQKIEDKYIKLIQYSNSGLQNKHLLKLLDNVIKIFFLRDFMHLIIIYEYQIEIYKISDSQVVKNIRSSALRIISAIQLKYFVNYLIEDCSVMSIQFFQNWFLLGSKQYRFDCKTSLQFQKEDLYIDKHSIHYKYKLQYKQIITLKEQIYEVRNVHHNYILMFTFHDNEYHLKLYQIQQEEFLYLYTLPTYNFRILYPFQYHILTFILMIKAQSSDQDFVILIYDLRYTAVESLVKITEIDREEKLSFNFVNETEYIYQYQGQLRIQNLDSPCFTLNMSDESYNFIQDKKTKITTQSWISNLSIDLDFHLIRFNENYKLQLLNQQQSLLPNNIVNLKNIFGNIDDTQINGPEDYQVHLPLTFTNNSINCFVYRFGLCVRPTCIQTNVFDLNTSAPLEYENMAFTLIGIGHNPDTCNHAIYIQGHNFIKVNEFNLCNNNTKLEKNYKIRTDDMDSFLNYEDIRQINDLLIYKSENRVLYLAYQYYPLQDRRLTNTLQSQQLDAIKLNNSIYLFLNIEFNYFEIRIINFTKGDEKVNYDILYHKIFNWEDLLANIQTQYLLIKLIKTQIYWVNTINSQTEVRFIVITNSQFAFLIKFTFNLDDQNNTKVEQLGILRFQQGAAFTKMLFIDNNYAVLSFECNEQLFINVFDISHPFEHNNIDSTQKLPFNNYTAIERYNKTHFVMIEKIAKDQQKVHLITLGKLRVECQGQCSKPAHLKLKIQFNNGKEPKSFFQIIIIIITLICILIKLIAKQVKKIKIQLNQI